MNVRQTRLLDLLAATKMRGEPKWLDPEPLPDARPPVPTFDDSLLPDRLCPWLADVSQRMQCPPEFPAVAALTALSSLIGRQVGIRPKRRDDWLVIPNLWGCVVGRPGIMKSPSVEEPLKPLYRLKLAAAEEYKDAMSAHSAAETAHEAMIAAAKAAMKKEAAKKVASLTKFRDAGLGLEEQAHALREIEEKAPRPPTMRRYLTSDVTPEKLGELLAENPFGMLVYRDELSSWLYGLDRQGREEGRGFYLQGWSGDGSYTFDRIMRGTVHIEAVCISVLGSIQPGPLSDYVYKSTRNGAGNDGLLQRFQLMVWPDDTHGWKNIDRWPDTEAKNAAYEIFRRLNSLDTGTLGFDGFDGIPFLRFSNHAQGLFDEWRTELETQKLRNSENEAVESHLSKYRSLAPSLALLFHLIDAGAGPVTVAAAARAFDWCDLLEGHARRVYGAGLVQGLDAAHVLASRIKDGKLPAEFSPRDVYLKGWSRLDKKGTDDALDILEESGWLVTDVVPPSPAGGRPKRTALLHPSLRSKNG